MNLYTDLLKENSFCDPTADGIVKHSQEYRVLATLRYLYPLKFDNMIVADAPDLQDKENDVSIEVTTTAKEGSMEVSRLFCETLSADNLYKREKQEKIICSRGYSIMSLNGKVNYLLASGTDAEEKAFFQASLQKKNKKIEEYKKKFLRVGLAVLWEGIPTSYAEENIKEWIFETYINADKTFDLIYVIASRFCIYYDIHSRYFEKRLIKNLMI